MLLKQQDFYRSLTVRLPGLVERVRRLIEESERKFAGGKSLPPAGGFLWEHTVLVASLSFRLAKAEKDDADLAALTALFHDSGKFGDGRSHRDERPEEEAAARMARDILEDAKLEVAAVGRVVRALHSLYNAGPRRNKTADIVHDADLLSKSGFVGVAGFFIKSALRGRNLETAIMSHLSKELTCAAVLPLTMRTEAARRMAARKSEEGLRFYRSFLAELKDAHGMDFKICAPEFRRAGRRGRRLKIMLVAPASCGSCASPRKGWEFDLRTAPGVRRELIEASIRCSACGATREIAFCLPEIA